jgi:alkylated DNA repair protein (DNA oxidative demethylase)
VHGCPLHETDAAESSQWWTRACLVSIDAGRDTLRDVEVVSRVLAPGAFLLPRYLSLDAQRALVDECRALMDGPVPAYVPTVRGGGTMHVRMLCLGLHWNGQRYCYEPTRSDFDGLPAPPLPDRFPALARECAAAIGMTFDPDLCIVNYYDADGRMGMHQDKDEAPRSLAAGLPVVSVSLGDTARFLFGGLRRRDPVETFALESGDVFVFGGEARLRYHGVSRVAPGTAPAELSLSGRINLTFRQYDLR